MRMALVPFVVLVTLAACGGRGDTEISLYKYVGSVQCAGGGTSLASMQRQLIDAGVPVLASACGSDGNAYPAVCGGADGRIGILEISVAQAQTAFAFGFAPLSDLPAATKVPCQ